MVLSDTIVYLWMFPCFLFFILPVLVSPVFLVMQILESRKTGLQSLIENQVDSVEEQILAEA